MTTTTGAASELLPCPCGQPVDSEECPYPIDRERRMYRLNCIGYCGWFLEAPTPEQCIAEWQNRATPPARVTEGAQREAVAYIPTKSLEWMRNGDMDFCTVRRHDSFDEPSSPLFDAPPPPDRVQPERVEADEIGKLLVKLDAGAETRDDCDVFWAAGNCIRKLLNATPNDASGGVTEERKSAD